jgi:hypothetical protein
VWIWAVFYFINGMAVNVKNAVKLVTNSMIGMGVNANVAINRVTNSMIGMGVNANVAVNRVTNSMIGTGVNVNVAGKSSMIGIGANANVVVIPVICTIGLETDVYVAVDLKMVFVVLAVEQWQRGHMDRVLRNVLNVAVAK